jgi:hypothetical protein
MFKVLEPRNAIEGTADVEFVGPLPRRPGFDDAPRIGALGHFQTW